jgi:UDP-2,3-diacylglucosamine pyrophosphatase LpxH
MRRLFIISDLHLGGSPDVRGADGKITRTGYQLCHAHRELVEFIAWVGTQGDGPPEDLELVVNGDLVDFLADDDRDGEELRARIWTENESEAIRKLDRIVERSWVREGYGVFEALRDFLAAGHRLTLLLGNHDVELALPAVRGHLTRLLGGDGRRLVFIHDGEAYTVGTVLIEHGNRYDHWNAINYSDLRQERSMCSRRLPVRKEHRKDRYFVVPAGTYLVIHFLNRIKSRYRFVDLLKPETAAVVPLLVALEPSYYGELDAIVRAGPIALHAVREKIRPHLKEPTLPRIKGRMRPGGGRAAAQPAEPGETPAERLARFEEFEPVEQVSLADVLKQALKEDAAEFAAPGRQNLSARGKAKAAWEWTKARLDQVKAVADSLSEFARIRAAPNREQRLRELYAALRRLNRNDDSFNLASELDGYKNAAEDTAELGRFEVVTYGHTHLPKKVALGPPGAEPRWYFNTGTWCDVLRLPWDFTSPYAGVRSEVEQLMTALAENDFERYLQRYLTFLEIELRPSGDGHRVNKAELYSYGGRGRERCPPLTSHLAGGRGKQS